MLTSEDDIVGRLRCWNGGAAALLHRKFYIAGDIPQERRRKSAVDPGLGVPFAALLCGRGAWPCVKQRATEVRQARLHVRQHVPVMAATLQSSRYIDV